MKPISLALSVLTLIPCLTAAAQQQGVEFFPAQATNMPAQGHGLPGQKAGTEQWLVQFEKRSFDLSAFRKAAWSGADWQEVEPILANYQRLTQRDQAGFKTAVEKMGGRVYIQYWLVNAAAIEIPFAKVGDVRKLPNVRRVDPNLPVMPAIKVATNAANHNSDASNALGFKGKGIATCIVDTGLDSVCGSKNRPHRTFYEEGDLTKRNRLVANLKAGTQPPDNSHPHGTGVAGIAAGGNWGISAADNGHAPQADIVGISISNSSSGGSSYATQGAGWQMMATNAVKYKIKTANMSYHGEPNPTGVSQQALDAAALNADIMICVAAGNTSSSTRSSISCANGLAVAAISANTHKVASFSSRGPLSGDTARFYPDIAGCGVNTVMPRKDNESTSYVGSGTSMGSPQVCGAATVVRSAVPTLRADETKSILLASALDISGQNTSAPYNSRNAYGMGMVKTHKAVLLALNATGHGRGSVTTTTKSWTKSISVKKGKVYRGAVSWMRQVMTSTAWSNLDVELLDGASVIASSKTTRNLYEVVFYRATADKTLTLRVTGVGTIEKGKQEFGWAFTEGTAPPIPSSYTTFGAGCPSGSLPCGTCVSENWNSRSANKTTSATRIGILASPGNIAICGLDFYIKARGAAAVTLNVSVHTLAGQVPGTLLTSGKMTVGTTLGTYHVNFAKSVKPGNVVYFVFDNADKIILPASPTGQIHGHSEFTTSWSQIFVNTRWQYRVHCDRGRVTPILSATGKPILNKSFDVNLASAPNNAATMFLIGLSSSKWGSTQLPLTYAAPCQLLCSPDVAMMMRTNAVGGAKVTLAIPSRKDLVGITFFNQYLISNNVNAIGVIASNGGSGSIGEF